MDWQAESSAGIFRGQLSGCLALKEWMGQGWIFGGLAWRDLKSGGLRGSEWKSLSTSKARSQLSRTRRATVVLFVYWYSEQSILERFGLKAGQTSWNGRVKAWRPRTEMEMLAYYT